MVESRRARRLPCGTLSFGNRALAYVGQSRKLTFYNNYTFFTARSAVLHDLEKLSLSFIKAAGELKR